MQSIDLIQPRHSYAPEAGKGHIYSNTSLYSVAARLKDAGVEVFLHDENMKPAVIKSNVVGMNLLGAPYIPVVIERIKKLREEYGNELQIVLGGQVMTTNRGLSDQQFHTLFGDNVFNGMKPGVLESLVGVEKLKSEFETSLIPVYESISDEEFLQYFSNEVSLFVSQGCNQGCSFCAAVKGTPEKYREIPIIGEDLLYLARRLAKLGIHKLDMYISNLDVWQSPKKLNEFANIVKEVKSAVPGFTFSMRGLAGTSFFMKIHENYPHIVRNLVDAGFNNVGYGVDGIGAEVRKGINKPQNNEVNILGAIELSRKEYDITPELLMVFGHVGVDNEETLKRDLDFVKGMVDNYQAVPRPHISKPFIPGNDGRTDPKFQEKIALLIKHPHLFQALDFTALANSITHGDKNFQDLVNYHYLEMCKLKGNTTLPIVPYELGDSAEIISQKKQQNEGKFDR